MHVGGPGRSQRPSAGDSERSPRTARKTRKTQGAGHDRKRSNSARTGGRTCRTPAEPLLVCLARPNFSDGSRAPRARAAPFLKIVPVVKCMPLHGKMGMWLEGGFNARTLKNGTQAAPHRGAGAGGEPSATTSASCLPLVSALLGTGGNPVWPSQPRLAQSQLMRQPAGPAAPWF